jgi:hypothetical protein
MWGLTEFFAARKRFISGLEGMDVTRRHAPNSLSSMNWRERQGEQPPHFETILAGGQK